jgi:hypothetical protein
MRMRRPIKRVLRWFLPLTRRIALAPRVLLEEYPNHPDLFDQYRHMLAAGLLRVPGGWRFEDKFYPDYLTVGGSSCAIQRTALRFCSGSGLDIGAGYWPLPGSTPIDPKRGSGKQRSLDSIASDSQDYVFSSHTLEHFERWRDELCGWIDKLRIGGFLFLYLPHPDCGLWHPRNPYMSLEHKWVPDARTICDFLSSIGLVIVERDDGPDHFYSFFVCARKVA